MSGVNISLNYSKILVIGGAGFIGSMHACRNEKTNRALWEVGYMLENMLLQTKSLGISYKSKVFTKEETGKLKRNGISEAVAALLL